MKCSNVFGESASALKFDGICCHICSPQKRRRISSLRCASKHSKHRKARREYRFYACDCVAQVLQVLDFVAQPVSPCSCLDEYANWVACLQMEAKWLLVPTLPQLPEQPGVEGRSQPDLILENFLKKRQQREEAAGQ